MNGGFALKLGCAQTAVVAALKTAARDESMQLAKLRRPPDGEDDLRILLGIRTRDGETIVVTADRLASNVLDGIGEALAAKLRRPICLVVDSDEGTDRVRSWHGGDAMSPEAGWACWDDGKHSCFALTAPPATPLGEREASAIRASLDQALPSSIRALGARFVEIARRDATGPIVRAIPRWQFTVTIPDVAPVIVSLAVEPETTLASRAVSAVAARLDQDPELAARRVRASSAFTKALAHEVPGIEIASVERCGFSYVTFHVRARIDGVEADLEFCVYDPSELPDDSLAENLRDAIEDERTARADEKTETLGQRLDHQLARGELEAAAATYRSIHAPYFAAMAEPRALELSLAKVTELAKFFRPR